MVVAFSRAATEYAPYTEEVDDSEFGAPLNCHDAACKQDSNA